MVASKARGAMAWLRQKLSIRLVLAALALLGLYALIGCPIRFFTGLPCPGCGMTRAALSLAQLRLEEAFHWHPLVFALPLALPFLLVKKGPLAKAAVRLGALAGFAVLFVGVYLLRLFWLHSPALAAGRPLLVQWLGNLFA